MKYSVIIPTYNHLEDCLKPCIESLMKFTSEKDIEFLIVANGCTDGTKDYLNAIVSEDPRFIGIWADEPLGFTKASNMGAEVARGKYLVFLNNDTVLLNQSPNTWLKYLVQPFSDGEYKDSMGATGPLLLKCSPSHPMEFVVGFCMMTTKSLWSLYGPFDEVYSPGAGEDTEYCIKLQKAGYAIKQVPNSNKHENHDAGFWVNEFPIYHKGEGTMHDDKDAWAKIFQRNTDLLHSRFPDIYKAPKKKLVLCSISTKNRYLTTLPLTIMSVALQTVKPEHITIYDDSDDPRLDLRTLPTWTYILQTLDRVGIGWNVVFSERRGQHHNHQKANLQKEYALVWRLDDDVVVAPDCLEKLVGLMGTDFAFGAVGGPVVAPDSNKRVLGYRKIENKMTEIFNAPNVQWEEFVGDNKKGWVEVEHLYSCFLYRAGLVDYELSLSPAAHREETIFTGRLRQAGHKLAFCPHAVTYHYRNPEGGIRAHKDASMWDWDEKVFDAELQKWGTKLVVLDNGLGDHFMFLNILPELKAKYKEVIISCCYPDVFEGQENCTLISIASVPKILKDKYNIYGWMTDHKWEGHVIEAYKEMYLNDTMRNV